MDKTPESQLENVRELLLAAERKEVARLQARVDELDESVARLEQLIAAATDRSVAVGEVLVDAIQRPENDGPRLGKALQPSLEHAVHVSARDDSSVLADALYPVMGPALRKMIAELFTFGDGKSGATFSVEQVLLIERDTGLLLAASAGAAGSDADIVSGMLDAIRLFVQDAFDATEHDGLRDLRVGETSVLVEWGPQAVLASVTRGLPTDTYRTSAAQVLEEIHFNYAPSFEAFDGDIAPFESAVPLLEGIGARNAASQSLATRSSATVIVGGLCLVAVIVLLLIVLL